MICHTELAWAAGFYDGEGSTSSSYKNNYRQISMAINQAGDPCTLNRFCEAVGNLGTVKGPYFPPSFKAHYQQQWLWSAGKLEHIQQVLCVLWPYLSQPKKDQAHRVVSRHLVEAPGNAFGVRHGMSKLTEPMVLEYLEAYDNREGRSAYAVQKEYAARFGVSDAALWHISHGNTWTHLTKGRII